MLKFSLALSLAVLSCAALSSPAFADHAAIGGGGNASGGIHTATSGTLGTGKFSLGVNSQYIESRRFSDEQLIEFASNHIHAHSADHTWITTATGTYGFIDDLMLSVSLPYIHRENIRAGNHSHNGGITTNTAEDHGDMDGIGDVTLMGKYRFVQQGEQFPLSAALMAGLKIPTGQTDKKNDGEKLETEHQPGSGSWDPALGFAVSKTWKSYSFDASLLYAWGTEGSQDTDLGDRANYGIAVSKRLGGEMHDHGKGELHQHRALDLVLELNGEWSGMKQQDSEADRDSGGTQLFLSPGLRYTSNSGWATHLSFSAPVNNNQRRGHPDTDYKVTLGIGRAF